MVISRPEAMNSIQASIKVGKDKRNVFTSTRNVELNLMNSYVSALHEVDNDINCELTKMISAALVENPNNLEEKDSCGTLEDQDEEEFENGS